MKYLPYLLLLALASCSLNRPSTTYDARVAKSCDGKVNCFTSLQHAIDAASGEPFHIRLAAGRFEEKVTIKTPNIRISGEGMEKSFLFFGLPAAEAKKYHRDNWGTPGSATLTVAAENIHISLLTVQNTFDYLANDALASGDPARVRDSQAVAVLVDQGADKVVFDRVSLESYQDTLFIDAGRSYFHHSRVSGSVDFIFGAGQAVFERSDIISRRRGRTFGAGEIQGHVTAASTPLEQDRGFVFIDCKLLREDGVPDHSVSLGRPWHPTRNFADGRYADPDAVASVFYYNTYMDKHIVPHGWESMRATARDGSKSLVFTPAQSRFGERKSHGPGTSPARDGRAISESTLISKTLGGWKPLVD